MKLSFEEAKQQVAEKHGYPDWKLFIDVVKGTKYEGEANKEVFELGCNEAVKADRAKIRGLNPVKETTRKGWRTIQIDDEKLDSLPLPFPDIK